MKGSGYYPSLKVKHLLESWLAEGFRFPHCFVKVEWISPATECSVTTWTTGNTNRRCKGAQHTWTAKCLQWSVTERKHSGGSSIQQSMNLPAFWTLNRNFPSSQKRIVSNLWRINLSLDFWKVPENSEHINLRKTEIADLKEWRQAWCLYKRTKPSAKAGEKHGNSMVLTLFFVKHYTFWICIFQLPSGILFFRFKCIKGK